MLLAILFVVGMRTVVKDGLDYRRGVVVGVSFWLGVGFQNGVIYPEYFAEFAGGLFQSGMTAGGTCAIIMTLFMEAIKPRRRRMEVEFNDAAIVSVARFLNDFAKSDRWAVSMMARLDAVGEETLLTLLEKRRGGTDRPHRLRVSASREDDEAVLEFMVASGEEINLEDSIAQLGETTIGTSPVNETSLRPLRHFASSIHHQQYHDTDIVTVRVKRPDRSPGNPPGHFSRTRSRSVRGA